MSLSKMIQGNLFKFVLPLKENGTTYPDLATADAVKVRLENVDGVLFIASDDTDPLVTLNDPELGTVSWQLSSVQTATLDLGVYRVAVEAQFPASNVIEWNEAASVEVTDQIIS